ncbi:MAG: DUF4364 family protein [Tissierellia bacterium]|nr:DUF4364 family protein [Tissierellia bacterium]
MDLYNTEDIAQNKLLILYILSVLQNKITNAELTELILDKGYMNYFALQQYIRELIESELIESVIDEELEKYGICEKGVVTLKLLENKIPDNIKNELENKFSSDKRIAVKDTEIISEYYKKENNQYTVNLKLVENEDVLFSIYLEVATEEQGKEICKTWKNNTESIYKEILTLLVKENI